MDVGSPPKIALFLSLTLMNLVAVGIFVYAPPPVNERKSSKDNKKAVVIRKRVAPSLDDGIGVKIETDGASPEKITKEENLLESETKIIVVTLGDEIGVQVETDRASPKKISGGMNLLESKTGSTVVSPHPPSIENSELMVDNEPVSTPNVLQGNNNSLNVITLNENFGNDSSKEGSDASLSDICGHGAEMRYMPQDVGKSVTAVIAKSFQLIDTFNTKVVPAVENVNEQIAKTVRLEKSMDSSVVGTINASICPAVIRMSDSIKRINEKINRIAERSVSCQVSESLLAKSVRRKSSFFSLVSPKSEARIICLFSHMNCRTFSKRKDRPSFKTSTVQYWANRKRSLIRKKTQQGRKIRSKENLQNIKTTEENVITQEEPAVESSSNFSDASEQQGTSQKMSSKGILEEEEVAEEPHVLGDFHHDTKELTGVKGKETSEDNKVEVEMNCSREGKEKEAQQEPIVPSSHFSEVDRVSSRLTKLPSYLSSSEESDGQRSTTNVKETSQTFQVHFFNNAVNDEIKEHFKYGSESPDPPDSVVCTRSGSRMTSFTTASEILNERDSLQLTATVQNTVERICGPLSNRKGLQDVLAMLDPKLERNTVENLFLLILKIFDAWSESQLTIVPSRALSRISESESTCMNSNPMRSKSVDPSEERLNLTDPANYYSCMDTTKSEEIKPLCEASAICVKEDGTTTEELNQGTVEETLSTTPKCIDGEMSMSSKFQEMCNAAITNDAELRLKAVLYKEQYSIARKIAAECVETAISTSDIDNDCPHSCDMNVHETMKRQIRKNTETDDSELANLTSSEDSFYSWAPDSSSDDYSYHECDGSLGFREASEKFLKKGSFGRLNLSKRNLVREQEKFQPNCLEVKENTSEAQCSSAYYVSSPGSAVVLKSSSIESWMLNSTSGDGAEIRNSRSELRSETISDISSRPISFTTEDTSDAESNHSLVETTASESSKDFQIRRKWSSRLSNKMQKKRPKTPKTAVAAAEAPSHAQSDCAIKVTESFISHNASLSDEN